LLDFGTIIISQVFVLYYKIQNWLTLHIYIL